MRPRIVVMSWKLSLLALLACALFAGLGCGKYGKPRRISQPGSPAPARADSSAQADEQLDEAPAEPERDEVEKNRKP
jgi:hypothetical protein